MKAAGWTCVAFGVMALIGCIAKAFEKDWMVSGIREIAGILWFMLGVMFFKWDEGRKSTKEFEARITKREQSLRELEEDDDARI
jgi:hypothetical protein